MNRLNHHPLVYLLISLLISLLTSIPLVATAEETQPQSQTPIDFSNIKKIIKNDLLEEVVVKKNEIIQNNKKEQQRKKVETYRFPSIDDFWSFISEYWIVQNSSKLMWDFEKSDQGLDIAVQTMLENLGLYEVKFKILLTNNTSLFHFALPAGNNECIFLLSYPFMRSLDLTKTETALLIVEDYFRLTQNYFKEYVYEKDLDKFIGGNFYQKNFDLKLINKVLKNYSYMIFEKGFSHQQQYEVTKKMAESIRVQPNLLASYATLLNKQDLLVKNKNNKEYSSYINKIYPTPETQLQWLSKNSNSNIINFPKTN
ncbi:MAG: hypothetical protein HQK49_01140 [Oligoflexia bacterium]|nr:hypothetical protein [Oligoflexia bacterium]